ncbi:MAG: thiamine phosphate synthase [Planctomycetota bacterium]
MQDISSQVPLLRVLDAAGNRAREGMRVAEDYARFVLDDRHLTERLKTLRHALAEALTAVPRSHRLAARETQHDVGTGLNAPTEFVRSDARAVLAAALARTQEGLRSLEEYGKVLCPDLGKRFEQLRYQTYTLERAIEATQEGLARLKKARLYVLIGGCASEDQMAERAAELVQAGADVLQFRDKGLSDRELLSRARRLREVTQGTATLFVLNDRPDLAVLCRADGVHVGQDELTVKDTRTIVGPRCLVGVSTHSIEQARQAVLDGANYIGVGPTFPSTTKPFAAFPGTALLAAVAAEIGLPAFAIGGINEDNLEAVLATGIGRVAVSGAVCAAADHMAAARRLKERLTQAAGQPSGRAHE